MFSSNIYILLWKSFKCLKSFGFINKLSNEYCLGKAGVLASHILEKNMIMSTGFFN